MAALATAVNLSPTNPSNEKRKFATDFYDKFDGEPFKTAAENVKFERETAIKTLAAPQKKFDPNASLKREQFSLTNLTVQAARTVNQTRANFTRSQAPKRASNLASNLTKRP
ncbi:hypothetical protein H740_02947 [Campylobacter showae CC57C]|uniref:Uncharacterized protein n=1 Tax=Campylobacter showae CC57C TaxID=1073353 RepID=M3H096_9BACT|nr:hypothetical protein H740_02947 [Campylobacter showae CC57C]